MRGRVEKRMAEPVVDLDEKRQGRRHCEGRKREQVGNEEEKGLSL
jgi:hypothetical protein